MKKLHKFKSLSFLLFAFVLFTQISCKKKTSTTPTTTTTNPPSSDFTFSHNANYDGMVEFHNYGTSLNMSFAWNFGDGTTSTLQSPIHQFSTFGTPYTVSLKVTDTYHNLSSTTTKSITPQFTAGSLGIYDYAPGYFTDPNVYYENVTVTGPNSTNLSAKIATSIFAIDCNESGMLRYSLPSGTYTVSATKMPAGTTFSTTAIVTANNCTLIELFP